MKLKRIDRRKFGTDVLSNMLLTSDKCQALPDQTENQRSSIPIKHYNQQHCQKTKMLKMFEEKFNCSILAMFGTTDLGNSVPMCNGSNTQKTMGMMEEMSNLTCPAACIEENIETSISFTILSDEVFNRAAKAWMLSPDLSKEQTVWMDLYFTSLKTEVTLMC